ncbi:MAG: hypothetical protein EBR02_03170 [Alphaproteobacteria bacterium]|nr:hypothetical protein [Alphaproteobacteria bacterium]
MVAEATLQPFPPFGMLALVRGAQWSALANALRSNPPLAFDTARYPYFDRALAEAAKIPPLYNNLQVEYPLYAGLRFNIAALRNQMATAMLGTSYTVADKRRVIPRLKNIAEAIGDAIANRELNPHTIGVTGAGAGEIYEYLLYIQDQAGLSSTVKNTLRRVVGKRGLNFNLPPIETTPFCKANLASPAKAAATAAKLATQASGGNNETLRSLQVEGEKLADIAEQMIDVAIKLDHVEDMDEVAKEESVEEARTILRWLRNLQATDRDMEEWMAQGTATVAVSKASKLQKIVQTFVQMLRRKADTSDDAQVREAVEAVRAIALFIGEEALRTLPEGHPRAAALDKKLDSLPEAWEKRSAQPVQRLLDIMEAAIERLSGQLLSDMSVGEKLAAASANINKNLSQIRGKVDTMKSPAREESVELARDILDKLKKAPFSQKTAKEMVDKSTPQEKLAMAQKVDEGVEAYKNIVNEAAQKNPDSYFSDARIKEASEAASCFAHTIALMAAKELPGSVAAAQQISSEAARDPEEWKKLHGHTVERLVKSMEGGVEKAANDIAQEQEQDRQEEQGQEAAQDAAQQASDGTRKRRRRRRSSSGKGGGKARRQAQEMSADDRALGQGRFREEPKKERSARTVAAPAGLNTTDLAAVREVAGALFNSSTDGGSGGSPSIGMKNVLADEKIVPDDKTNAESFAEREKQGKPTPGKRN